MSGEQLFQASEAGDVNQVKHLLQSATKADIEFRGGQYEETPLIGAAEGGHSAVVRLLLDQGAQVNAGNKYGFTALHRACRWGHAACVSLLLQHPGADVNLQANDGRTALHRACVRGDAACVSLLLQYPGLNINLQTNGGLTALHLACGEGHAACVSLLLQHPGADVNVQSNGGETALHLACWGGHPACVSLLLQHPGAQVNLQDNTGDTPLHTACEYGEANVVTILLQHGANVDSKNKKGKIPLDSINEKPYMSPERTAKKEKNRELLITMITATTGNHIYVKTKDAQTHLLQITPDTDTVEDVKKMLHTRGAIPADEQQLYFDGKVLEDDHTIGYYAPNKAVLDMIPQSDDDSTWHWSDEEKKTLSAMSAMSVIFMGEKNAGKSSLVNTILQGRPYTTHIDDRTVVADLSHWVPPGKEKTIFTFVDCGGHRSYRITGQYFHRNSRNNVTVLCHDISLEDFEHSFGWIKSVLASSPKSNILIVLTKGDVTEAEMVKKKKEYFIKRFVEYLEKEKEQLCTFRKSAGKANHLKKQLLFDQLEQKYLWLIRNVENIVIVTSCKEGYIESVQPLIEMLIKLAEDVDNMVLLPEEMQLLYMQIGSQGAKSLTVKPAVAGTNIEEIVHEELSIAESEASSYSDRNHLSKCFCFSFCLQLRTPQPANVDSSLALADTFTAITLDPKIEKADPYLNFDDIIPVYELILQKLRLATDNMEEKLKYSLSRLHMHSLLMFFQGGDELEKVVFHDMGTVMQIFRCVFHHKVPEFLEMEPKRQLLMDHFKDEQEFEQDRILSKQGLFSTGLVGYLLALNDCKVSVNVVVQLLEILETGFSFIPEKKETNYLFIPFFVEEQVIDPEIETKVAQIKNFEHNMLTIQCCLKGNLPITFWNYLLVRFLKHLQPTTLQIRDLWANGFFATVGESNAKVLLLRNEHDQVDFYVKGDISDQDGHTTIWNYIGILSEESDRLMKEWWPGLITSKTLACTNCRLMRSTTESMNKIFEHDLNQILCEESGSTCSCICCREEFPAALVYPLSKGAEKKLKQARDFINSRVPQQHMEPANDGSLKQLVRHEVRREVKHEVRREVRTQIAPYEDYAFRLPQIRNHHQHLVENLYVLDVLDHLVPVFSVDDYEAIKALEKTPRNQTRMFLYVLDKRGRTALDVLIRAIREDLHLAHLTHLLVHLEDEVH